MKKRRPVNFHTHPHTHTYKHPFYCTLFGMLPNVLCKYVVEQKEAGLILTGIHLKSKPSRAQNASLHSSCMLQCFEYATISPSCSIGKYGIAHIAHLLATNDTWQFPFYRVASWSQSLCLVIQRLAMLHHTCVVPDGIRTVGWNACKTNHSMSTMGT